MKFIDCCNFFGLSKPSKKDLHSYSNEIYEMSWIISVTLLFSTQIYGVGIDLLR